MIRISTKYYALQFKTPAGTSRGVLTTKPSWFITIEDTENPQKVGFGECSIIPGLSHDDREDYASGLAMIPKQFDSVRGLLSFQMEILDDFPSIQFGLECAIHDFNQPTPGLLFESDFTDGSYDIPINGLIWMGDKNEMLTQVKTKINEGWDCIKLKIGAINFDDELEILKHIRSTYSSQDIVLRVDANGAFHPDEALEYLKRLADLDIHSIEQPIMAGQWDAMATLCALSPLPIALDEELIGLTKKEDKKKLLDWIHPPFIILKPSLVGGLVKSKEWIDLADFNGSSFWITSALESNIGLNAIAQWTAKNRFTGFQGLGTGKLFRNNISSPLEIKPGFLCYNKSLNWDYKNIYSK